RVLGLEDRHHVMTQYLVPDFELLLYYCGNATAVSGIDYGPLFGAVDADPLGSHKQLVEPRHRLHQLNAVGLFLQALVDLEEWRDSLRDQRLRNRDSVDGAVHRLLEQ